MSNETDWRGRRQNEILEYGEYIEGIPAVDLAGIDLSETKTKILSSVRRDEFIASLGEDKESANTRSFLESQPYRLTTHWPVVEYNGTQYLFFRTTSIDIVDKMRSEEIASDGILRIRDIREDQEDELYAVMVPEKRWREVLS